ncbi:MAG: glycerol kinase, partial [Alphaproteobacteria bacterium]|nr:glycerol kinase [Alphaproteobacteria bacterium]
TRDLLQAMQADWPGNSNTVLRVDGGMSNSETTMQFLADMLNAPIERPANMETTALGAAILAGHQAGLIPDLDALALAWKPQRRFEPAMNAQLREKKWAGWQKAIGQTIANQ